VVDVAVTFTIGDDVRLTVVAVDRAVVRVVAFVVPLAVVVVTPPVVVVDNAPGVTSDDEVVDSVLSLVAVLAVVVDDAVFLFPPPHAATTRLTLVATTSHRPNRNRPLMWSPLSMRSHSENEIERSERTYRLVRNQEQFIKSRLWRLDRRRAPTAGARQRSRS
jgi:hypothetical protein